MRWTRPVLAVALAAAPAAHADEPYWNELAPIAPPGLEHLAPGENTSQHLDVVLEAFRATAGTVELEQVLNAVALHHPEHARVLEYGRSAGGRPLLALEIGTRRAFGSDPLPTWLVCTDLTRAASSTSRGAVELLMLLVEDVRAGGSLLASATWVVIPAPLPDALDGDEAPDVPDVELDFPGTWDPWTAGAGPYPLARPETRALAELLTALPTLAGVSLVGGDGSASGGLSSFCTEQLTLVPRRVHALACPGDIGEELAAAVRELPDLRLTELSSERVGTELWLVDVLVENRAPQTSRRSPDPSLRWEGARVVVVCGAAWTAEGAGEYRSIPTRRGSCALGALPGGARRAVRLVVDTSAGSSLVLATRAPRAATSRLELALGE